MYKDLSVAILSGGKGRRFGSDKTLTTLRGKPLYSYPLSFAQKISDDVMFISRDKDKYQPFENDVRYLEDDYENQSALAGILTAIDRAKHDKILMIAADMPFVNNKIVDILMNSLDRFDIATPKINDKLMLLISIYNKNVREIFLNFYSNGIYRLNDVFSELNYCAVYESSFNYAGVTNEQFININREEDLHVAETLFDKLYK